MISSTPGFCKPMALSIPQAVSATRGVGLPGRSEPVAAFIITAPSLLKSSNALHSLPNPKQPEAGIIGFSNCKPGKCTDKSIIIRPPLQQKQDHLCKFFGILVHHLSE